MLNTSMVNPGTACLKQAHFCVFFSFQVDFCFSKDPLNMIEYLKLTKASVPEGAGPDRKAQIIAAKQ